MSRSRNRAFNFLPCDFVNRAGLGTGIAVKESSFQPISATTTTFPVAVTLDDGVTTPGIELIRNGISSGLQTVTGGSYDIAYIVSSTVTTTLTNTTPVTFAFELITSTGRVLVDTASTAIFPTGATAGTSVNTNLELGFNIPLFPGEIVSIVLRSVTPAIAGAGVITINTATLFMTPTPTVEPFQDESSSSCEESSSSSSSCTSSSSSSCKSSSSSLENLCQPSKSRKKLFNRKKSHHSKSQQRKK